MKLKKINFDKDNKAEKSIYTVSNVAWICTTISTCIGIAITKNPACLWAFVFPFLISE